MRSTVQKWGNSLAVRIPKAIAHEINVKAGSSFELSVDAAGELTMKPVEKRGKHRLRDLLSKVTPQNLHAETDWGMPEGKEVW